MGNPVEAKIHWLSEQAAVVEIIQPIQVANKMAGKLVEALILQPFEGFIEAVPAYDSVTVYYEPTQLSKRRADFPSTHSFVSNLIMARLGQLRSADISEREIIVLPICYDPVVALDLHVAAEHTGISEERICQLHSEGTYQVQMLGFMPGFPYLSGLPPQLAIPRKAAPRLLVPAGSVAIGGTQTGIYPFASPGGWQIIGRTPAALFRPDQQPVFLLEAGDRVVFRAITIKELEYLNQY